MSLETPNATGLPPRTGQVVLPPAATELAPADQIRSLYRLSDPALSELDLEELLEELLVRIQEVLDVDTVAILLYEPETNQLVARAAKGIEEEVEQGVRIPVGRGFAGRIAAERVAIFIADVDHADIMNPILRQKGIRSLLGLPLIVEGELIGVLHVGCLKPRTFGPRDLAVLQVAAARAAPGIERARLYAALEQEHSVAMILQRSLLPQQMVNLAGVSVAARYMPATHEVGGDWYDFFPLPGGRFGIAIGDVVGHGLKAAALMGQLRTALHSYALEDHRPARTLQLVDRYIRSMSADAMATAAYVVLDPDTGRLTLASAGHLPALVLGPDGGRTLELPPSPPLGAFPYSSWTDYESSLLGEETLLLYTDGLVERPGTPLTASIGRLLDVTASATSADEACRLAVEHMIPFARLRDDVAIVAMQYGTVPDELDLRLPTDPAVLSDVRRIVRRWLRAQEMPDQEGREVVLAISEVCANAIEHAYSPVPAGFDLTARRSGEEIVFVVRDQGAWRAPRGDNRGRGLNVARAAMDEVEVRPSDSGTEVVLRKRLGTR